MVRFAHTERGNTVLTASATFRVGFLVAAVFTLIASAGQLKGAQDRTDGCDPVARFLRLANSLFEEARSHPRRSDCSLTWYLEIPGVEGSVPRFEWSARVLCGTSDSPIARGSATVVDDERPWLREFQVSETSQRRDFRAEVARAIRADGQEVQRETLSARWPGVFCWAWQEEKMLARVTEIARLLSDAVGMPLYVGRVASDGQDQHLPDWAATLRSPSGVSPQVACTVGLDPVDGMPVEIFCAKVSR